MKSTLEDFGSQINILGNFNPPVISPNWLRSNELIGQDDEKYAMESKSLAITPDISRFETEWFWIQVINTQFILNSKGPVTPTIMDLAIGIFTLLAHTPLTAIGLNSFGHFKMSSVDEFHKVGDVLAPKNIWKSFYPESDGNTVGLQEMSIEICPWKREEARTNAPVRRVSIGISNKVPLGVQFTFNHHFPISSETKRPTTDIAIEIIRTNWSSSMSEAQSLFTHVVENTLLAEGGLQ